MMSLHNTLAVYLAYRAAVSDRSILEHPSTSWNLQIMVWGYLWDLILHRYFEIYSLHFDVVSLHIFVQLVIEIGHCPNISKKRVTRNKIVRRWNCSIAESRTGRWITKWDATGRHFVFFAMLSSVNDEALWGSIEPRILAWFLYHAERDKQIA